MHNIKNFIFVILMFIAATLGGAKAYIDHRLRTALETAIKSVADKVTIEYADVSTSLLGSVIINNLHLTVPDYAPVHIDTAILHKAYQLPQHILITLKSVQFSISDTAPPVPILMSALGYAPYYLSPRELRGLGYARINADIDIEAKSNEKNKMSLSGLVNAYAWGELNLSLDLNNVPAFSTAAAPQQIQLAALSLTYTNKGLVNQVFTWLAQRNKMSLAHFKQALITKLKSDINQTRGMLDATVLSSLQQFIQTPQRLTIHLQPTPPIMINALFYTSPKLLRLKMTSTKSLE
ncbi:MAG: hypothetical protein ABFS56_15570 [Pseudomonadota bacterium]